MLIRRGFVALWGAAITLLIPVQRAQACDEQHDPLCLCPTLITGSRPPPHTHFGPEDEVVDILMFEYLYLPPDLTVFQGTTVRWINLDVDEHDAVSNDGFWDSGYLEKDQAYSFQFVFDGIYDYYCTLHGGMNGRVTVLAPEPGALALVGLVMLGAHRWRQIGLCRKFE